MHLDRSIRNRAGGTDYGMNDPQFVVSGAAHPRAAPADGPGTGPPAPSRATVLLLVLAAVGMGCFTVLWTASSFLLAGPPCDFGPAVIGPGHTAWILDTGDGREVVAFGDATDP